FWILALSFSSLASASCAAKVVDAAVLSDIRTIAIHWMSAPTLLVFMYSLVLRTIRCQLTRCVLFPDPHLCAEHFDFEQQPLGVDPLAQRREFLRRNPGRAVGDLDQRQFQFLQHTRHARFARV